MKFLQEIIYFYTYHTYGLFTSAEMDSETNLERISYPMDTLYNAELYTLHRLKTLIPKSYFCITQESETESLSILKSGNVFKPLWLIYIVGERLRYRL